MRLTRSPFSFCPNPPSTSSCYEISLSCSAFVMILWCAFSWDSTSSYRDSQRSNMSIQQLYGGQEVVLYLLFQEFLLEFLYLCLVGGEKCFLWHIFVNGGRVLSSREWKGALGGEERPGWSMCGVWYVCVKCVSMCGMCGVCEVWYICVDEVVWV